jgi:DNA-binding transcriptional LysR family regulator
VIFARVAIYFEEVAKRGALRRAADSLRIAPSAIDRQILQLEEELGTKLFDRTASGMRMTAAGELLLDGVRRWRRDMQRITAEIDNLVGLKRGQIAIGLIEGASEFVAGGIRSFRDTYPGIHFDLVVDGAQVVVERVLRGELEVGITINPPDNPATRIERTMIYQIGAIVLPDHPLATLREVSLADCADYPLLIPAENLSLRWILEKAWARRMGFTLRGIAEVNNTRLMKALVLSGVGVGWITAFDASIEIANGSLVFLPLSDAKVELSALSIVTASGRAMSTPAALFTTHMSHLMEQQHVPTI